jgi:hypothetical protein
MCSLYDARGSVGRFCFLICSFVLLGVIPAFAADARYAAIKKLARNEFQNDKQIEGLMIDEAGIDLIDCNEFKC